MFPGDVLAARAGTERRRRVMGVRMTSEDRVLAAAFLDGEPAAVETLSAWSRYATIPFRRRLGDQVDDVVQEVLVALTEALRADRFRGEARLETYVRRAAAHRCLDRVRSGRRWRWTGLEGVAPASDAPSPFDRAAARQGYAGFTRVLEHLPEHCRQMWSLLLDGLSYQQMSARLGVRPGALRVRLLRCRRRAAALRRELEEGGNAGAAQASGSAGGSG